VKRASSAWRVRLSAAGWESDERLSGRSPLNPAVLKLNQILTKIQTRFPVRDHDNGRALGKGDQPLKDFPFRFDVYRIGGFVQDE
jgi:hypothetical protein